MAMILDTEGDGVNGALSKLPPRALLTEKRIKP